jgi:hypothetical protein
VTEPKFPWLIRTAMERAAVLDVARLPQIRCLRGRQRREDACKAVRAGLVAIFRRCDVATYAIGVRDDRGQWSARGISDLTALSGLQRKARVAVPSGTRAEYRRIQRVLELLGPGTGTRAKNHRPGVSWITVDQRRERGDMISGVWVKNEHGREFRSRNAIRRVTDAAWRALKLDVSAPRERASAIKRLRAKKTASNLADATLAQLAAPVPRYPMRKAAPAGPRDEFWTLYDAIKASDPTLTTVEVTARADELLRMRKTLVAPVKPYHRPAAGDPALTAQADPLLAGRSEFWRVYDDLQRENPRSPVAELTARADAILRTHKTR